MSAKKLEACVCVFAMLNCLVVHAQDGQTKLEEDKQTLATTDPCSANSNEYLGPECPKIRFITIAPVDVGGFSAIRVTLTSLMHPQPPNLPVFPPPNFS